MGAASPAEALRKRPGRGRDGTGGDRFVGPGHRRQRGRAPAGPGGRTDRATGRTSDRPEMGGGPRPLQASRGADGRCPDRDRPPASPGRPRGGDRGRDDGGDGPDLADRPRRPGGRQARRHGEQGPAGRARARGLRPGAEGGPRGRLRGERRRRHPDRPGPRGLAGGQPGPGTGGDPQRDLQLHPDVDDPRRPLLRRRPPTGPGPRLRRGRPHPRRGRDRHRAQAGHPGPARLRRRRHDGADPPRGDRPPAPGRHHLRGRAGVHRQAPRPGQAVGVGPGAAGRADPGQARDPPGRGPRPVQRRPGRGRRAWATRSSRAEGAGRCRPPRPSSAT